MTSARRPKPTAVARAGSRAGGPLADGWRLSYRAAAFAAAIIWVRRPSWVVTDRAAVAATVAQNACTSTSTVIEELLKKNPLTKEPKPSTNPTSVIEASKPVPIACVPAGQSARALPLPPDGMLVRGDRTTVKWLIPAGPVGPWGPWGP